MSTSPTLFTHVKLSEKDFQRLGRFIHTEYGIKMPDVKKTMVESRLQKRLKALDIRDFGQYITYVFSPEGMKHELVHMVDLVTTNKTDFFREPNHFEYLTQRALPQLIEANNVGMRMPLKIWSAGCSTGEEPYTLAMVLSEFGAQHPGFRFSIYATDISSRVLESAQQAIYTEEKARPIPTALKKKYLLRSKDRAKSTVRIVPGLRSLVTFDRLNFMDDRYQVDGMMDIIFCRNVIIYFDRPTQEAILNKLVRHLKDDSFIFMGHSETLSGLRVPLVPVAPTVYLKRSK